MLDSCIFALWRPSICPKVVHEKRVSKRFFKGANLLTTKKVTLDVRISVIEITSCFTQMLESRLRRLHLDSHRC